MNLPILEEAENDTLRTTLGTVPGTVRKVNLIGVCRWTSSAVLRLIRMAKTGPGWKMTRGLAVIAVALFDFPAESHRGPNRESRRDSQGDMQEDCRGDSGGALWAQFEGDSDSVCRASVVSACRRCRAAPPCGRGLPSSVPATTSLSCSLCPSSCQAMIFLA